MTANRPPLEGLRIIESSLLGAAAISTSFADLGAEVIKVESPAGDYIREMTWPIIEGVSLMHYHLNRGKKSITLDLKTAKGVEIYRELAKDADVVIETMRPGTLAKLGLGFTELKKINPKIVFCTVSGYGSTGPYRAMPSHGIAYDTWSGVVTPAYDDEGFCYIPSMCLLVSTLRHWWAGSPFSPVCCGPGKAVRAVKWNWARAMRRLISTGIAAKAIWLMRDPKTKSPATRPTATNGDQSPLRACGTVCATSCMKPAMVMCCLWRRSRRSGKTSAPGSNVWICSTNGPVQICRPCPG